MKSIFTLLFRAIRVPADPPPVKRRTIRRKKKLPAGTRRIDPTRPILEQARACR
jgi:hypothetical protein